MKFREGDSFAPRRWPLKELTRQRGNMASRAWEALYQQNPVEDEGNILKRNWWRKWKDKEPPACEYIISVYDTAFEEGQENDFTARTTWGIFLPQDSDFHACILLERLRERLTFPVLREMALEHYKDFKPDRVLVEKKASGHSLLQELRLKKVPVSPISADRSKLARAHAASAVLEQGAVWYMDRKWADDVINECAAFPTGSYDDIVDTCVHAWRYMRRLFWLQLPDEDDDEQDEAPETGKVRRIYG